jgi:hypothetical protein
VVALLKAFAPVVPDAEVGSREVGVGGLEFLESVANLVELVVADLGRVLPAIKVLVPFDFTSEASDLVSRGLGHGWSGKVRKRGRKREGLRGAKESEMGNRGTGGRGNGGRGRR